MALDFPSNPTNGQTYNGYVYSTSIGAWQAKPAAQSPFYTSDSPPANPTVGDAWFNTTDGTAYFYYYDGNTYQWVEGTAPISANGYYSPNYLINGGFDIWQRGTSFAQSGGGVGVDMWREYTDSGSGTQSKDTTNFVAGLPQQSYKFTANANSTNWSFWQILESSHCAPLIGQTVTFSVYLMSSIARTFRLALGTNTTTDAGWSAAGWTTSSYVDVSVSTSWARYSFTTVVPATAKTLQFSVSSNGANMASASTINVAGAQVELGSTATAFRRNQPNIQAELAACHRYFRRYTSGNDDIMWNGTWYEANGLWVPMIFPTPMRAKPVVSYGGTPQAYGGGGNVPITSIDEYAGGVPTATGGVYVFRNAGGNTVGRSGFVGLSGAGNYIQFNAEL